MLYSGDTVILGFLSTTNEVGLYNAAYKIILFIITLGATYFDAIFPVASRYYQESLPSLDRLLSATIKLGVCLGVPMVILGFMSAKTIILLFYGANYARSVTGLQILLGVAALMYLNMVYGWGLLACDKQDVLLRIMIVWRSSTPCVTFC